MSFDILDLAIIGIVLSATLFYFVAALFTKVPINIMENYSVWAKFAIILLRTVF